MVCPGAMLAEFGGKVVLLSVDIAIEKRCSSMKTEPQRACPSCGNEFSGAMELSAVCMLCKAACGRAGVRRVLSRGYGKADTGAVSERFEHYELVTGEDGKPVIGWGCDGRHLQGG